MYTFASRCSQALVCQQCIKRGSPASKGGADIKAWVVIVRNRERSHRLESISARITSAEKGNLAKVIVRKIVTG